MEERRARGARPRSGGSSNQATSPADQARLHQPRRRKLQLADDTFSLTVLTGLCNSPVCN